MEVGSSLSDPPADPPLPHDSASHHAEEPSASSSSRTPAATRTLAVPAAPRVNRSPDDILRLCCPNRDWSIVLKNCDWRFESQCRLHLTSKDSAKLYAPYSQKTFSRALIHIHPMARRFDGCSRFYVAQMAALETFVASTRGGGGTSAWSNTPEMFGAVGTQTGSACPGSTKVRWQAEIKG